MATVNLGRIKPQWQGSWSSSTQYVTDDMVAYNNDSWIATTTSTNSAPSDGNSDWDLLARGVSAGSVTANEIADGAVTAAKLAPGAAVPDQSSASGQFLTSDGTNASWASLPPSNDASALTQGTIDPARMYSGAFLNYAQAYKTNTFSTGTNSQVWVDVPNLSVNITPSSTSSKVLVIASVSFGVNAQQHYAAVRVVRNGSTFFIANQDGNKTSSNMASQSFSDHTVHGSIMYIDSPSSTSAVNYKIQLTGESGRTKYINRGSDPDGDANYTQRTTSSIVVFEIK